MADPYATCYIRADYGVPTDVSFLYYMLLNKKWLRSDFTNDLRIQLRRRTNNERLSVDLTDRIMSRLYMNAKLSKVFDAAKSAYNAAKSFELTPKAVADAAVSMLGGIYGMAKIDDDRFNDRNRNEFLSDGYIDMMIFTYLFVGRVQPHARPGSREDDLKGAFPNKKW